MNRFAILICCLSAGCFDDRPTPPAEAGRQAVPWAELDFGRATAEDIPLLLEALGSRTAEARRAQDALVRIGEPAVPGLIGKLSLDEDPQVRTLADGALVRIGHPAVPQLIAALDRPLSEIDSMICGILGNIHPTSEDIIDALCSQLHDPRARLSALTAIAWQKNEPSATRAVPHLIGLIRDDDRRIRVTARRLLWWIDEEAARATGLRDDPIYPRLAGEE